MLSCSSIVQLFGILWTSSRLLCPWDSPQARILEWVAIFSSKGIFPIQRLSLSFLLLLHWQAGALPLVPPGSSIWGSESLIFTYKFPNCVFLCFLPLISNPLMQITLLSLSLNRKKFHPEFLNKFLPLLQSFISHL